MYIYTQILYLYIRMEVDYILVFLSSHGLVGKFSGSHISTVHQYLDLMYNIS